jgi:hypothetical protein
VLFNMDVKLAAPSHVVEFYRSGSSVSCSLSLSLSFLHFMHFIDVSKIHITSVTETVHHFTLNSGIGGMHYGLEMAQGACQVCVSMDISTLANKVYRHNFPNVSLLSVCFSTTSIKVMVVEEEEEEQRITDRVTKYDCKQPHGILTICTRTNRQQHQHQHRRYMHASIDSTCRTAEKHRGHQGQ